MTHCYFLFLTRKRSRICSCWSSSWLWMILLSDSRESFALLPYATYFFFFWLCAAASIRGNMRGNGSVVRLKNLFLRPFDIVIICFLVRLSKTSWYSYRWTFSCMGVIFLSIGRKKCGCFASSHLQQVRNKISIAVCPYYWGSGLCCIYTSVVQYAAYREFASHTAHAYHQPTQSRSLRGPTCLLMFPCRARVDDAHHKRDSSRFPRKLSAGSLPRHAGRHTTLLFSSFPSGSRLVGSSCSSGAFDFSVLIPNSPSLLLLPHFCAVMCTAGMHGPWRRRVCANSETGSACGFRFASDSEGE